MRKPDTVIIYKDRSQQWRWRLHARNGRKIAAVGESLKRRIDCVRIARRLFPLATIQIQGVK